MNITNIRPLPAAAPQHPATITLQRALQDGVSPEVLRAVGKWNARKNRISMHNRFMETESRRPARSRMTAQAAALRAVADGLERLTWNDGLARAA